MDGNKKVSKQNFEITAPSAIKGIICLNSPFPPHCLPLPPPLLHLPFLSSPNPRNRTGGHKEMSSISVGQ
jgi:hypothetical protein